jgi:hypothetical protein
VNVKCEFVWVGLLCFQRAAPAPVLFRMHTLSHRYHVIFYSERNLKKPLITLEALALTNDDAFLMCAA